MNNLFDTPRHISRPYTRIQGHALPGWVGRKFWSSIITIYQ